MLEWLRKAKVLYISFILNRNSLYNLYKLRVVDMRYTTSDSAVLSRKAGLGELAATEIIRNGVRGRRLKDNWRHHGANGNDDPAYKLARMATKHGKDGSLTSYHHWIRQVKHGAFLQVDIREARHNGSVRLGLGGGNGKPFIDEVYGDPDDAAPPTSSDRVVCDTGNGHGTDTIGSLIYEAQVKATEAQQDLTPDLKFNPKVDSLAGLILAPDSFSELSIAKLEEKGYGVFLSGLRKLVTSEIYHDDYDALFFVLAHDPDFEVRRSGDVINVFYRGEEQLECVEPLIEDDEVHDLDMIASNVLQGATALDAVDWLRNLHGDDPEDEERDTSHFN